MRNVTFRSMKGHGLPRGAAETTGIAEIAKIVVLGLKTQDRTTGKSLLQLIKLHAALLVKIVAPHGKHTLPLMGREIRHDIKRIRMQAFKT